ncbi:AraC family transcriptional regulator [Variovorax sp. DXTD-1]|uniref:AraC family transcriptional regulator n=1 Tax=Variovorax sp. DXTD-1 TaxID=2495592 RepID=UPI000F87A1D5|nr:AraC family transcriptional regulator [Variovorax sp. DXTD-1]RST50211.1 AraC family transcriptional regulator [Variovorax sp. DXTD-1]
MNSTAPPVLDPLSSVAVWIEQQLDQSLTLELVAAQVGLSPYHFSRLFTARMGRSVMAYVRGRRLVRGARRLCDEPDLKLVDLAFDCGFESQEAFTRAFKRLFGVSPGRFRSGFAVEPIEGQYPMNLTPAQNTSVSRLPELVAMPAFRVAGPSRRFDEATKSEIPQLWSALIGALPFAGQVQSWATYGVVSIADKAEGCFQYMAGVGVESTCVPPSNFSTMEIPAATYVVFRITLNGTALQPQVKEALASIWGELIPTSDLKVADGPDFELYDGRFDPQQPGAFIDFHVPVEA